jgi:hypothetical protein
MATPMELLPFSRRATRFQRLRTAIEELAADSPLEDQAAEDLAIDLIQWRRLADRIELIFAARAAAFAATNEYEVQGSVTPIEWIRHNCNMTGAAAADRVNTGEQMPHLARTVEAVESGEIGYPHLSVIARTTRALANDNRGFAEEALLDQARKMSVGRLTHVCYQVRHQADPEGVAMEQRLQVELRGLDFFDQDDGMVGITGRLDSVGCGVLRAALEPLAAPSGAGDDRQRNRRLADALIELASHTLSGCDPGSRKQGRRRRPVLQVTTSLDTLCEVAGAPGAAMEWSLPLPTKTVQRLACDSSVVRILLGPDSAVIDVGRARRSVSAPARRALDARDEHCRWPQCERPPAWSDAHHFVHWAHDGRTDLSNLILLCGRHHWLVHEGGWELASKPDGTITAIPTLVRWRPWEPAPQAHHLSATG